MAQMNPTWGEERIANELSVKLGIRVAPRTIAKYLRSPRPRGTTNNLRWSTFVRNHARATVACDFFVSVTATFRVLYVFVAMEIGSRRILHTNVTAHPTADWTIQQFREFLAFDHPYRFLIHDRDRIFSPGLDAELKSFGLHALKTPPRTPTANAFCERLIGTIRRECLAGPHPHKLPAGYRVRSTPFSAGCSMNIGLRRRLLSDGRNFCGAQPLPDRRATRSAQ